MKKNIYLAFALLGLIIPYTIFISLLVSGFEPLSLVIIQFLANPFSAFFAADLAISIIVFWIFMVNEAQKMDMKNWWLYILASLTVGLSFALPLFLYFRERQLEK